MDDKELSFLDKITAPLTGNYRKKKPISVKAADVALDMTPVGSAVEIGEELSKEDPNYGKVAIIAAGDALGAAIPAMGPVAKSLIKQSDKVKDVWSYPKQLYDSAATSINEFKRPAGYNKLKKRGEIKDGDVIVDIGGGRFDNLVEDAAEEGATVKVYDPFNRTPEHNAAVVDSVKDGQADMAMSHNVLNVIKEDENILSVVEQAENAVKPGGKAHFSVYEGSKADREKGARQTSKGWQRFQTTSEYLPFVEKVFGKDNVTLRDSIITATKSVKGFSEGGMAIEEQMAMNFGKIPDNTVGQDPVSGNDIPLGSTAENVRDDIPTNLSEGEIVVPADVVNFHGVKLFEDLRAEAKLGYAQMAQDGRIGGQPMDNDVDMDMDISLTLEDLETSDDAEPVQMDEGGLLDDDENTNLIGGEEQFNQGPYYSQKGGFDMENAYAGTGTSGPVLEMREYMNDDGHRIFITFIDGVPQMEIPEGYYPVEGEGTVVATNPPIGGSGGSDMGDSGSGTDMPTPEPINYKELSMEELSQLIEDQKSLGSKFVKTINPLIRIAMWDQTRRTKNEIERRLSDPATSEVDKIRLRNLLEIANRDEPGLIKTLLDKVTGSTLETAAGNIPKPKIPDVDFDDPTEAGTVAAPYTPNDQEEEPTTTPGVNEKSPAQIIQDSIDIKRIEDEMKSQPRPTKDDDDKPFVQPPYDPLPPADSGFGGMGPDPAEKFGGSQARFQPERTAPTREQQMLVQGINKGARVTKKRKKKKSK